MILKIHKISFLLVEVLEIIYRFAAVNMKIKYEK